MFFGSSTLQKSSNCVIGHQVMVTNVTSLLKTVKAVEDEATRGTRALEATIECIRQELVVRICWRRVHGLTDVAEQQLAIRD